VQPADRDLIVVRAVGPLRGAVDVAGAKNSVLKLMAACLLTDGRSVLRGVPRIVDVGIMGELLSAVGLQVEQIDTSGRELAITNTGDLLPEAPHHLVEKMRASIVVLGPLLARTGEARVALPGGDDFGPRPIDMHLRGLEAMGATFELRGGYVRGVAERGLQGADVAFEFPSVGATENVLMAAVLAKGTTVIDNAAREPEIVDLCSFLTAMGARIEGVGTPRLVVHGVAPGEMSPAEHTVVPDRVEAATYLAAVGMAGGEVEVRGARADQMEMLLRKLGEMGMRITPQHDGILAEGPAGGRLRATDVQTLPYPGVATDYKPLITTMLSIADGSSIVTENLFAGRFRYVEELLRLGARIRTDAHHAIVRGVERLEGAPVKAHDIRAGAAMVVAGLVAEGETTISDARHVDRGYDDLVGKLRSVGAGITRLRD
jgi:UDP-N-acetylglucosamine 1-carboxyvinyltransferase